ncbi:Hairy enhancer-of-split related with YRPW motif [Brachionus plicatilis]|uniref:Hairy enhancer-of-split related with YRPW motif n=1 Tax=Brachionus plicatilis TaxID=10195 RepID=A0A3M7S8I3_BRAPC|nr:Hairy enhancer-of-split related with YRPW motif [Brachionus plicatilis]
MNSSNSQKRGSIEKKRRDRINLCMTQLKSLVPEAIRKDQFEKLEKAEILQLTTSYLKSNSTAFDFDFKRQGFRDCMFDISTYLINCENLSIESQFYSRLLSHLKHSLK